MEFKRTYTLVDIARKLDRPRTTVKEWSDLFRDFLPTVGVGRTMRYEEPAVEIFAMIAKMKEAGEPNEMIRIALQQNVREIAVTTVEDEPKPMMMQIAESYTQLLEQFKRMDDERRREHDELLNRLRLIESEQEQRIESVKRTLEIENVQLKDQIERLTKALNDDGEAHDQRITKVLREIHELKEAQTKKSGGWWPFGRR